MFFGHLGEAEQAINTTLSYYHHIKVTYLNTEKTRSNMKINLGMCLWPLDENVIFTLLLIFGLLLSQLL